MILTAEISSNRPTLSSFYCKNAGKIRNKEFGRYSVIKLEWWFSLMSFILLAF